MANLYLITSSGFASDSDIQKALEKLEASYEEMYEWHWRTFKVTLTGDQIVALSEKFDVMLQCATGDARRILLDVKGGKFRQR